MPAHAPRTLAQAIERVCTIEEAGAPYPGLSDAIAELGKARTRLDGLEEDRALLDVRTKAYERALELAARIQDPTGQDAERVIDIARFLAPAWADLEDPLGPTEDLAASEAAQAVAEGLADRLRDQLTEANTAVTDLQDRLAASTKLAAERGLELMELRDHLTEGQALVLKSQGLLQDAKLELEQTNAQVDALTLLAGGRADRIELLEAELERLRRAWLTRIFVPTAPDPVGP